MFVCGHPIICTFILQRKLCTIMCMKANMQLCCISACIMVSFDSASEYLHICAGPSWSHPYTLLIDANTISCILKVHSNCIYMCDYLMPMPKPAPSGLCLSHLYMLYYVVVPNLASNAVSDMQQQANDIACNQVLHLICTRPVPLLHCLMLNAKSDTQQTNAIA